LGVCQVRETPPSLDELVENYAVAGYEVGCLREARCLWPRDRSTYGEYEVDGYPFLGSHMVVRRQGRRVLFLQNEYGLLNLGLPSIEDVIGLPAGDELLLDWWGQAYVLSLKERRLGLAADGRRVTLRGPECRVGFSGKSR
ncbi:MAG: hypothetical protein JXO22_13890, partial [Phycisphaerae bacterium]|nr:hypothetical protein [Phycisphaerae bacterium]